MAACGAARRSSCAGGAAARWERLRGGSGSPAGGARRAEQRDGSSSPAGAGARFLQIPVAGSLAFIINRENTMRVGIGLGTLVLIILIIVLLF
jgi:hypothetical protein